ncbi:MAG: transposase [Chloroflexota bacterium]|nr:transposase [Chloroflexota bacterium]
MDEAETTIVFDKFHLVQPLHTAVDRVRRAEHRGLRHAEDGRLTGTKYLWLRRPQDLPASQRRQLRTLLQHDLTVARAWMRKEQFQRCWTSTSHGAAQTCFARWCWRAPHSRLRPMAQVARMIQRHLPHVLTSVTHGLTNAVARRRGCPRAGHLTARIRECTILHTSPHWEASDGWSIPAE